MGVEMKREFLHNRRSYQGKLGGRPMLDFRSCGMFPFVPAPSIGDGAGEKRADLFESAEGSPQAGEFPRAPASTRTRRTAP